MMYASGHDLASIAEKFGRKPQAIRILMSKMGVKRGDDIIDQEPGANDLPKKESKLKKPWYLKK